MKPLVAAVAVLTTLVLCVSVQAQTPEFDALRERAEQGIADAQVSLGGMYATGRGVPQDYVQAHMWHNLAASAWGSTGEERERAVRRRDDVAGQMTPDQIAEAQRLAREWNAEDPR